MDPRMGRTCSRIAWIILVFVTTPGLSQNIDMGEAYRSLDQQAFMMSSEFPDATVVTRRQNDGGLITEVNSLDGKVVSRWEIPPSGPITVSDPGLANEVSQVARPEFEPSMDWANLQALSLWRDLRQSQRQHDVAMDAAQLTWSGSLLRPWQLTTLGASNSSTRAKELAHEVLALSAHFQTDSGVELVMQSVRHHPPATRGKKETTTAYANFTTKILDPATSAQLGILRWFDDSQVLVWDLPGVTTGWIDPERQRQPYPFEPDLAWGAVQAFGFWQANAVDSLKTSLKLQIPDGCTGLHWLDGTVYKKCCDDHDLCYAAEGCTAWSWFIIGAGWSCIQCNIDVVYCFLTTFVGGGGATPPSGGGDPCSVSGSEWCPAECFTCNRSAY